jgi:hypothetical protein
MKILCAMLALLSVGAVSGAQKPPASEGRSLRIGLVTVWLGMSKAELQAELSGTAQELTAGDTYGVLTFAGHPEGDVRFRNGVVTSASRNWLTGGSDGVEALIGAIDSFTQEGLRACVISHRTDSSPSMHFELATIQCGAKRLVIRKGKIGAVTGVNAGGEDEEITEWIDE